VSKAGKPIVQFKNQEGFQKFLETAMTICESLFSKDKMQDLL